MHVRFVLSMATIGLALIAPGCQSTPQGSPSISGFAPLR